jgi:hypothetical protein
MAEFSRNDKVLVLFDVDGTLTAARQVYIHGVDEMGLTLICRLQHPK